MSTEIERTHAEGRESLTFTKGVTGAGRIPAYRKWMFKKLAEARSKGDSATAGRIERRLAAVGIEVRK